MMVQTLLVYDDVITFLVYSYNDFIIGVVEPLDLSGADEVYLTVKESLDDDDNKSLLQLKTTSGLLYIAKGEAATPGDGVLTPTDTTLQVVLKAESAALLAPYADPAYYLDIKKIVGGNPITVTIGRAVFKLVSTQALT